MLRHGSVVRGSWNLVPQKSSPCERGRCLTWNGGNCRERSWAMSSPPARTVAFALGGADRTWGVRGMKPGTLALDLFYSRLVPELLGGFQRFICVGVATLLLEGLPEVLVVDGVGGALGLCELDCVFVLLNGSVE